MINYIKYYYNIDVLSEIKCKNNDYYFSNKINDYKLSCVYFKIDINNINKTINIIKNKYNSYYSNINNKNYILIQINKKNNIKINEKNIINNNYYLGNINWKKLWILKVDNYENWFNNKDNLYKEILYIINYIIGIIENCIQYISDINVSNQKISVVHERISENLSVIDYYDPTKNIYDFYLRDYIEYIKEIFLSEEKINIDLLNRFNNEYISNDEKKIIYVRLIYPSLLCDIIDDSIINNKLDKIKKIDISKYQNYIMTINNFFKNKFNIEIIRWHHL